jgi:hypothetical protein
MSINNSPVVETRSVLENHLKEKIANRDWLYDLLFSNKLHPSSDFPYALSKKGAAVLSTKRFAPLKRQKNPKTKVDPQEIAYWVTIPTSTTPQMSANAEKHPLYDKIQNQVKLLTEEGFYEKDKKSSLSEAKSRLFVCFGLNQYKSIDQALNDEFIRVVNNLPVQKGLHFEAEGFFWKIPFSYKKGGKALAYLDKPRKAFKKVKVLDPKKAAVLRQELELNGQGKLHPKILDRIPFCKIRNRILKSDATSRLTDTLMKVAPENTHYFLTMDDDALSLKGQKGYFKLLDDTILDALVEANPFPSLVSFGYSLPETAGKLSKVATRIDMAVRSAMHARFPLSCYMPEPGVAYLSGYGEDDLKNFLQNASFEPQKVPSRDMESRRMIESLEQSGLLDPKETIFKNVRALTTSEPPRMAAISQEFALISPEDLKKTDVIKNLKKLSQNHFKARSFAQNLYFALPDKFKSFVGAYGAIVIPVSKIFKVFDPLELQKLLLKNKFVLDEKTAFNAAFELYLPYISALKDENNIPDEWLTHSVLTKEEIQQIFAIGRQSLLDAFQTFETYFLQHDVEWTNEEKEKVEKTAQAACLAIYETIRDILEKNSFHF